MVSAGSLWVNFYFTMLLLWVLLIGLNRLCRPLHQTPDPRPFGTRPAGIYHIQF